MVEADIPGRVVSETTIGLQGAFIWYCIPKNASRTLSRILRRYGHRLSEVDKGPGKDALKSIERPKFAFAFVRSPYERLASAWRNKVFDPPVTRGQQSLFARSPGLIPGMGLNDFVRWLDERDAAGESPDAHWRPQHQYLCNGDRELCVDYLGRLETFDRDLSFIARELDLPLAPRHDNATPPGIFQELDDESVDIIQRLYAFDFDLLGYDRADSKLRRRAPVARARRQARRLGKLLAGAGPDILAGGPGEGLG